MVIAGKGNAEIAKLFESERLFEFFIMHGKATTPLGK
jgi:hypothetical protein